MGRKKPFSGKQKKLQLQEKRNRKESSDQHLSALPWRTSSNSSKPETSDIAQDSKQATHFEKDEYNPKRYCLNFLRDTREEIERRKENARTVHLSLVSEVEMEVSIDKVYPPGSVLDMPKRLKWNYAMSKHELERKEETYFESYLENIHQTFGDKTLSYFEHNLETWRQAWRVLEMSDIIVMVTDVRHPILHFSPALYDYVVKILNKQLILVLNKIDLVPASVVAAWTSYFKKLFPFLHVVWFTSFPKDVRMVDFGKKLRKKPKPGKRIYTTQIGPKGLLQICKEICGEKVNLESWVAKIESDLEKLGFQTIDSLSTHQSESGDGVVSDNQRSNVNGEVPSNGEPSSSSAFEYIEKREPFSGGILTMGFVGYPNVGKSSLMNGLIGHKVVSTSVTPGHTKYFQTYFLTKTVKLCDSPGLVFPSLIDKQLQILSGIYPIAQVQEPYTPVGYLASRIPLVKILQLQHPFCENDANQCQWTAWDVCEAWANKRNYKTAKAARPDVYRAANGILRMAVDGRLCMYMRPPGYTESKDMWEKHENTTGLIALQATGHFHGGMSSGEGIHSFVSALHSEGHCSSDSFADSNSIVDVLEENEVISEEEEEDVTLIVNDVCTVNNPFALLSCNEDSD